MSDHKELYSFKSYISKILPQGHLLLLLYSSFLLTKSSFLMKDHFFLCKLCYSTGIHEVMLVVDLVGQFKEFVYLSYEV